MSFETNRWTELPVDQAHFFKAHIEAAQQTAFSTTAHQAGIVALNGARYSFGNPETPYSSDNGTIMLWPDPYANGMCMVTEAGNMKSSFVRAAEHPTHFKIEGIALGVNIGKHANYYGEQILQRHEVDVDKISPSEIALQFLDEAEQQSKQAIALSANTSPFMRPHLQSTGIEGRVVGRLFQSLSSLAANTVTNSILAEKEASSSQTYDLARTLLKVATNGARSEENMHLMGDNNYVHGALFNTADEIAIIRRLETAYPDTLGLTTTRRPKTTDDTIFVNHYNIQSDAVVANMAVLPLKYYDLNILTQVSAELDFDPRDAHNPGMVPVEGKSRRELDKTLARLITSRINT